MDGVVAFLKYPRTVLSSWVNPNPVSGSLRGLRVEMGLGTVSPVKTKKGISEGYHVIERPLQYSAPLVHALPCSKTEQCAIKMNTAE